MEYWEFLIQREGDRGWRAIKTGNLQLMEGNYRIIANSNLLDTPVKIRMTHQSLDAMVPQRRSQSRDRVINTRGVMLIVPFTQLHSGIWQFVCSGSTTAPTTWHKVLKLRVLSRSPLDSPTSSTQIETTSDLDCRSSAAIQNEHRIQLKAIDPPPLQPIELDRSTFASTLPGARLAISGACNLQLLSATLVHTVKIDRLSICLRHPQTSETIVSIDRSLPTQLDTFTFSGQLDLPLEPKIFLLRGEVNLYDRHNIQLSSIGFTVTVNLDPIDESERCLFSLFDSPKPPIADRDKAAAEQLRVRLDRELQRETFTPQGAGASPRSRRANTPTHISPLNPSQDPTISLASKRESGFTDAPDVAEDDRSTTTTIEVDEDPVINQHRSPCPNLDRTVVPDLTDDLELDFDQPIDRAHQSHNYDTLEIVVDDEITDAPAARFHTHRTHGKYLL